MATFDSTIPLSYETSLPESAAKQLVKFSDNSYHIESLSDDAIVENGVIVCAPLTETQKDTVLTFYTTNKNIAFDFVDPNNGETYTLYFIGKPKPRLIPSISGHYEIRLQVVGEVQ